jgi:hypothetical protein
MVSVLDPQYVFCDAGTEFVNIISMYFMFQRVKIAVFWDVTSCSLIDIVKCTSISRHRLGKHIPTQANALNNRTSIFR